MYDWQICIASRLIVEKAIQIHISVAQMGFYIHLEIQTTKG